MPEASPHNEISFFAETNFRGQRKRFGIKRGDRRRHVYIIGKTGMGKSTLLENMTIQDIQAGRGVAVVDPHGEYAERMLDFIPAERVDDVVYFCPSDIDYPIAFNIMEQVGEDQRHLVASALLGVFKKIFGEEVFSARMEYLLANAILALLEIPDSTLLGINRMFGEKDFRRRIVAQLSDPVIKGFWENEFAKYPEQFMREAVAAIQNKVGQFASNPLIRNIIGQVASSFDLREIMDREKIFIANLSKGRMGEENTRLLGAMIVTKLYLTAMSRVDVPERERRDVYLYVDEFQNFATESFANILSEARKYRLNLTVAHQYIAQMEEQVQHAIFGNIGTMIVFRIGAEDAELIGKEFEPEFTTEDLVNLGFTSIYVKLMIDGLTSRPFSAETLPPFPASGESQRETIIRVSRDRFGTPRHLVEENIRRFTGVLPAAVEAAAAGTHAGAGAVASGAPAAGEPAAPPATARKADRQLYEARCAVDGKPILVPFQPDGRRPVYCEDHMDLIKYRSKGRAPLAATAGQPASSVQGGGKPRLPQPPVSLQALQPGGSQKRERPRRGARSDDPEQRTAHLAELRRVLAASLREPAPLAAATVTNPADGGGTADAPQAAPGGSERVAPPGPQPAAAAPPKTIQPGETIRLE